MAQCQRCGAPILQGYDHCTNCGTKFAAAPAAAMGQYPPQGQGGQMPMGQYPPQGQAAAVGKNQGDGKGFIRGLSAKLDALGLTQMITGAVQVGYAVATFVSSVILFMQAQSGASGAGGEYYRPYVTQYLIAIIAMIAIATIGVMNFLEGRKKQQYGQWILTSAATVAADLTPIRALLPSILRNGAFVLVMGLGILAKIHITMGLIGSIGSVFALYVRYEVLKHTV